MRLYGGPLSLFSAKVRIALDEKGLDFEEIRVGWTREKRYEPHHPDVVALNPKRQVPILVDGDVVVYDSTRIFEYLEERQPDPALYPPDVSARARCRQLEAAADEILFPWVWDLIEEVFYPSGGAERDAARAARAREGIARIQAEWDEELADREHLCGAFSVADIAAFVMLNAAATLGAPPQEGHVHLAAWHARVLARPAVRRELDGIAGFLKGMGAAPPSA